ncbi:unnamed protein product [Psylliodes chrysocephalus]|uniref:Uncharacterized protein n=1 Tax=Psylliodes chrysocephalus TaxID=3402493 RepID=A0A9P0CGL4_9CUCU|nr:unnamed protein product [Psylliodes chrysocephala]
MSNIKGGLVCAARNCPNKTYNCKLSFFGFPKDERSSDSARLETYSREFPTETTARIVPVNHWNHGSQVCVNHKSQFSNQVAVMMTFESPRSRTSHAAEEEGVPQGWMCKRLYFNVECSTIGKTELVKEEQEDFETKNDSSDSDFECDLGTPKTLNQDDLED